MIWDEESTRQYQRDWYLANRERSLERDRLKRLTDPSWRNAKNEYTRRYFQEHRSETNAKSLAYVTRRRREDAEYREHIRAKARLRPHRPYQGRNQKVIAREKLHKALVSGILTKPELCSRCLQSGIIHGHHEDYSKPLEVIWLCSLCHGERHQRKAA